MEWRQTKVTRDKRTQKETNERRTTRTPKPVGQGLSGTEGGLESRWLGKGRGPDSQERLNLLLREVPELFPLSLIVRPRVAKSYSRTIEDSEVITEARAPLTPLVWRKVHWATRQSFHCGGFDRRL